MPMTRVVPHTTAPHQTCGRTCWHRLALLRLLSPPPPARFKRGPLRAVSWASSPRPTSGASAPSGSTGRSPTGSGDARVRRDLQRRNFADRGGRRLKDASSLEVLNPLGQRLRAPAERRVHRCFESAQCLFAGHDAFSQGVLGEVCSQAPHGVSEAAHAHTDERTLFCPGQVFVPAPHLASCAFSGQIRQLVQYGDRRVKTPLRTALGHWRSAPQAACARPRGV